MNFTYHTSVVSIRWKSLKKALVYLLVCLMLPLNAQSVKELENQRKQALRTLETTNKILNETKRTQRSSLTKLTIINKNISQRKELIKNITTEISKISGEVERLNKEKNVLENRLARLKREYARMVQEAHINRSLYARIMFILSAESFDQSYRRMRYLQEFQEHQKAQVVRIQGVKTKIQHTADSLNQHKKTQVVVAKQQENEAKKLTEDERKVKLQLTDLRKRERKLRADLKVQQKRASDLNARIERIIAQEIRKAETQRAAEAKRKSGTDRKQAPETDRKRATPTRPSGDVSALTREENLISGNFEANRGRLPWPTTNGFISGRYGIQAHPVLKHVTTNNKGIYIQTPAGSNVRAVFEGKVTQVFFIQGNNGLIIQHGNYRTVYANLSQIFVREGESVRAKQNIGKVYTDSDNDNKTELYFQIYNGRTVQNPESWITR